jgi:hypothetical protein
MVTALERQIKALRAAQGSMEEELATLHAVNARLAEENAELAAAADAMGGDGEASEQLVPLQDAVSHRQREVRAGHMSQAHQSSAICWSNKGRGITLVSALLIQIYPHPETAIIALAVLTLSFPSRLVTVFQVLLETAWPNFPKA